MGLLHMSTERDRDEIFDAMFWHIASNKEIRERPNVCVAHPC